ncbi:SMI1 / KNR4 family protein [Bremerella volcania]|uniref:SMI1 / KNR4 family protein n=1 Tax=Bremerella volcania TaxID=2527984 RepID=A0A518C668_9BACT|nr:SMI1/KNR4 family protein [Bremerella volcania]QDU74719.1 SMI1 / KNR4 family protein [Bremerella volcania]
MTEADLERMETELGTALPSDYREILLHFPIRFDAGTADGFLWDDVEALIERNQEYRTTRNLWGTELKPLPEKYFFIGDDKAGWQHLIDTTSEPSMVYTMEYESIERIWPNLNAKKEHQSLSEWFHDYLKSLRDDGIDISAEEYPYEPGGGIAVLIIFVVLMTVIFVLVMLGIDSIFPFLPKPT